MIRKHSDRSRGTEARKSTKARKAQRELKRRATPADYRALERELKGL